MPRPLTRSTRVINETAHPAVEKAACDLRRDLASVFGSPDAANPCACECGSSRNAKPEAADILVAIDRTLAAPESYRIEIGDAMTVRAADMLGAIYGIYRVSQELLGVPPLWFWTDFEPQRRDSVELKPGVIASAPTTFGYRGWFVNDEDLLTEWHDGSGKRDIRYPYYGQVINLDIADAVFEACLRCGNNLIIPASFVDVMNEPEAELVRRAAGRGLYVSQHHIEPLGMSHFGYENYWRARGGEKPFSYSNDPASIQTAWRDYAEKWFEVAGTQVVWQIGMRGKGDRPVWDADKGITFENAGEFISDAMRVQWEIVREVDSRDNPPVTTTLWHEMSKLMSKGTLTIPAGVTAVFCDEGTSQTMQDDFRNFPRDPKRGYGVYYHLGFWISGPHLVQGANLDKIKRVYDDIDAKGDTAYSIINTANIREHALGVAAIADMTNNLPAFSADAFLKRWAPGGLDKLYRELVGCLVRINKNTVLQDGFAWVLGIDVLRYLRKESDHLPRHAIPENADGFPGFAAQLLETAARLQDMIAVFDRDHAKTATTHHRFAVRTQAAMLAAIHTYTAHMLLSLDDASHLDKAAAAVRSLLEERKAAEYGKWQHWYRGDKKENWRDTLSNIEALRDGIAKETRASHRACGLS